MMVVCGVLNGREALRTLNLSMYLLFVGAMAMSGALANSGAGQLIGDAIASVAQSVGNPYIIGLVFFLVPFLLTQVMQNRGVMMIFIPIAIQACKSMGANPVGIIIMVQAACLSAFMTPMATPAVPMIMAEGNYTFSDMVKQSLIPAVLFCVVTVIWTMTVFPLYA
jgi:di/tricarboxylate transporter